jgi:hypothetical protein
MAGLNKAAELARSGNLPLVEVVEGYYNKRELCDSFGWHPYLVRKFLKPDRIRRVMAWWENPANNYERVLRLRYYEFEYYQAQIKAVEATAEWQQAKARSDRKSARRLSRGDRWPQMNEGSKQQ